MKSTMVFRRLLGYLKEHRLKLLLVMAAVVISTGFMVLAPFLVGKVTTALFASIADGVLDVYKRQVWCSARWKRTGYIPRFPC